MIAPTDLAIYPGTIVASARPVWFWEVDPFENALWAGTSFGRRGLLAWPTARWARSQCRRLFFRALRSFPG